MYKHIDILVGIYCKWMSEEQAFEEAYRVCEEFCK